MKLRSIPGTDLQVSALGLGTVALGRNWGLKYPRRQPLPSDSEVESLLDAAQDWGINLLDTAPAYGTSEERLGVYLKGRRRHWIICTKVGEESSPDGSQFDFRPSVIEKSIDRSLLRLGVDELDIVLIHSDGQDLEHLPALAVLRDLQRVGKVRATGFSAKTVQGGLRAVEQCDVVMVTYHPGFPGQEAVLDAATGKTGILLKKSLDSGKFTTRDQIRASLKFGYAHAATTSVVVGTTRREHLAEVVEAAEIGSRASPAHG
ncbi:MAG: aldo/keto reductase [Deltaproteobacteria bacterium]|nr:aldo/keto reductase [Deltaproteobacteria bacterium]